MGLYRKKPVVIEAQLFDGSWENARTISNWAHSDRAASGLSLIANTAPVAYGAPLRRVGKPDGFTLVIDTLEGIMTVSPGDWVIRGVQGEFYPCKPDIFAATYEEVHERTPRR